MSWDGLRHFERFPKGKVSYLRKGVGAGQNTGNGAPPRGSRGDQVRGTKIINKRWLWDALLDCVENHENHKQTMGTNHKKTMKSGHKKNVAKTIECFF